MRFGGLESKWRSDFEDVDIYPTLYPEVDDKYMLLNPREPRFSAHVIPISQCVGRDATTSPHLACKVLTMRLRDSQAIHLRRDGQSRHAVSIPRFWLDHITSDFDLGHLHCGFAVEHLIIQLRVSIGALR
jgi:hypothetical protein